MKTHEFFLGRGFFRRIAEYPTLHGIENTATILHFVCCFPTHTQHNRTSAGTNLNHRFNDGTQYISITNIPGMKITVQFPQAQF